MRSADLFLLVGLGLAVLGLVGTLFSGDLLRRVVGFNVVGSGVLLVLGAAAARANPERPDPVPHALVLTGIVVTVSVTAVAVGLVRRIERLDEAGPQDPP